jgi:hypothetical protein
MVRAPRAGSTAGDRRPAAAFPEATALPEVARPRTWLLRVGWRRHGLVDPAELPGAARSAPVL